MEKEMFRKFWIMTVNGWICDADYSGKLLKNRCWMPTFRRFRFIRSWDELNFFNPRVEIGNREFVEQRLKYWEEHRNE